MKHGLVITGVGDSGHTTYKKSRRGDAEIDRAVQHVLKHSGSPYEVHEFIPYGYDERQYCSPGFNLPVGCFARTPFGRYPEYHTSADNLDFVRPQSLADSFDKCVRVIDVLEHDRAISTCRRKASRIWADAGCTGRSAGNRTPRPSSWRCCGCSTTPTGTLPSWTSPNVPNCLSK